MMRRRHSSSAVRSVGGIRSGILPAVVVAALLLPSCGKKKIPVPLAGRPPVGAVEEGIASWYGHPYHGRRAANGEVYDMEKLTAAHRTLAFGVWVRVQNLSNGKQIDVRITDRGPFVGGRVIDLSRAAARAIDMIGPGTAKVRLHVVADPPGLFTGEFFAVQIGAFRDRSRAEALRRRMERRYGTARLVERQADPPLWRVLVGREASLDDAAQLAARIRVDSDGAFVVRLDTP